MTTRRTDISHQQGFTLIELLMVLIILGILLTIAVPSYLGFKDRANKAAAQANVRSAIPSVEAFYADNNTYGSMDVNAGGTLGSGLLSYDRGIKVSVDKTQGTTSMYCIYSTVGNFEYYKLGPGGTITQDTTVGASPCA